LVRLNSNGAIDSTFGLNGVVKIVRNGPTGLALGTGTFIEIVETCDDKIIVGGTVFLQEGVSTQAGVFRLNNNGSADTTFGANGEVLISQFPNSSFIDLVVTANSKIAVLSYSQSGGGILTRFKRNGQLDTSVGNGSGSVVVGDNQTIGFSDLELQKDGKFLLAGSILSSSQTTDLAISRLNLNLTLDTTFGIGGTAQVSAFPSDSETDIEVQNNGKILLLGSGINPVTNLRSASLTRFDSNGVLDFSFNSASSTPGLVIADNINPYALTISRNKAIIAGDVFAARRSFSLARYLLR
jgi:uncharacterized delta-60 repeat protein